MREDAASKDFARPLLPQADNQADTMAATIASVSVFEDKGVRHALAPISHPQSAGVAERAVQLVLGALRRECYRNPDLTAR